MATVSATDRLRRLLAMLPWVASRPEGVAIEEIGRRFDCTTAQVLADLETATMVGVYPYTPDTLIDVEVADGRVKVRYADNFTRPFRLTPGEGLALVAAARALLATPDADSSGVLARAVEKLSAVLGPETAGVVDVQLGPAGTAVYTTLRDALRTRTQVEIDYYRSDQGERHRRRIEPAHLWSADGRWYVSGWCHRAGGVRVFRVDRIASAEATGLPDVHADEEAPSSVRFPSDLPRVVLDVRSPGLWRFDEVPVIEREEQSTGAVRLTISVSSTRWLARTLVQLGPEVHVVEADPELDIERLVHTEAARLLARYRSSEGRAGDYGTGARRG